jgi:hypothetical protein
MVSFQAGLRASGKSATSIIVPTRMSTAVKPSNEIVSVMAFLEQISSERSEFARKEPQIATDNAPALDVRFGSKADRDNSGLRCPLWARSRHP